jgi:alpha-glucosidase (family GH31 glycosyl hydrolase)
LAGARFIVIAERSLPVHRPQYAVFPKDAAGFPIDDQYYVGSSGLLFKPVTAPGVDQLDVYLADNQVRLLHNTESNR